MKILESAQIILLVLVGALSIFFYPDYSKIIALLLIIIPVVFTICEVFALIKFKTNILVAICKIIAIWTIPISALFFERPYIVCLAVAIPVNIAGLVVNFKGEKN